MFIQCTHCLNAFDAPSPQVACPRCGNAAGSAPAPQAAAGAPRTMAMDASMVAEVMRGSLTGGPPAQGGAPQPNPYASLGNAPTAMQPPMSYQPPQGAPSFGAPQQQGYGGFGAPPQHQQFAPSYGAPAATPTQAREFGSHAVVSIVLSAVAFLGGGCNLVGLAGVAFGLRAYTSANEAHPETASRAKTARIISVVALVLTALVWASVGAFFLFASDTSNPTS